MREGPQLPSGLQAYFPEWLANNPYFSAGFGLAGIGFAASVARGGLAASKIAVRRRLLTSLEIPSKDISYQWVMQWLISNQMRNARHLGVETTHAKDSSGRMRTAFDFVPSPGRHIMSFGNTYLLVDRDRSSQTVDITTGSPWETLTLTTFAWRSHVFKEILETARIAASTKEQGCTVVYQPASGGEWRPFGQPKALRPFDSVILAEGLGERIADDVREFLNSGDWYKSRGIPYRRGYLLEGPPGCGKSSYVMAVAGLLKYGIAVINLADPALSDDRLVHLLAHLPPECLLLLEDVDAAISGESATNIEPTRGYRRLSFSGLLNALDGVVSSDERIIFMTTNKIDTLPPALIRPGRVDLRVHVGLASSEQLRKMFLRFFPNEYESAINFADTLQGAPLSMAEVQGFFLFFKNDPNACLENAAKFACEAKAMKAQKVLKEMRS